MRSVLSKIFTSTVDTDFCVGDTNCNYIQATTTIEQTLFYFNYYQQLSLGHHST